MGSANIVIEGDDKLVFTDIPMINGWVNFGSPFSGCQAAKDANGTIHLRGVVKNGYPGTSVGILPIGLRPSTQKIAIIYAGGRPIRLDINTAGEIYQNNDQNEFSPDHLMDFLSLDNVVLD